MPLSLEEVEQVALLARLQLAPEELETARRELEAILIHVETLRGLDTTGVEPTTHALPLDCPLRADEVRPGLSQAEALADAPRAVDGCFEVPRVIEVSG